MSYPAGMLSCDLTTDMCGGVVGKLLEEFKRRNVVRVALAYLVAAWLVMQVTDVIAPILSLPIWVPRLILALLGAGFVLALILGWIYELTPEGIRRDRGAEYDTSQRAGFGRKIDRAIIGVLGVAIIFLFVDNYVLDRSPRSTLVGESERSIAVLPFRDFGAGGDDASFVDGIQHDILTSLAKLSTFGAVISRTSTEQYRGTDKTIPQIGRELGVATILEGAVQRAGDRVRINVQLIDASEGQLIWAEDYDRLISIENIFAVQTEITREIVAALHGTLTPDEEQDLQDFPTQSMEAYNEYVLGMQKLDARTVDSLNQARAHFEAAIEYDPDYAQAYAGLANALTLRTAYSDVLPEEYMGLRQAAIEKALDIDPLLGEAYTLLGTLRSQQLRPDEAEEYYRRGIELSPNSSAAHQRYSVFLMRTNRFEEALQFIRRAIELDPVVPINYGNLAAALSYLGRREESAGVIRDAIERQPDFPVYYAAAAGQQIEKGRLAEALKWHQAAIRLNPGSFDLRLNECRFFIALRDRAATEDCIRNMDDDFPDSKTPLNAYLLASESRYPEAIEVLEGVLQDNRRPAWEFFLAALYADVGRARDALAVVERIRPEFLADNEIDLNPNDTHNAVIAANALFIAGETERANDLYDLALDSMQAPIHRARGWAHHVANVQAYAMRGDRDKAITALRQSIDAGWRLDVWLLDRPLFADLHDDPEWTALRDEVIADVESQRAWYWENIDEPPAWD